MPASYYPVPFVLDDPRWGVDVALDVLDVLELHGYPKVDRNSVEMVHFLAWLHTALYQADAGVDVGGHVGR